MRKGRYENTYLINHIYPTCDPRATLSRRQFSFISRPSVNEDRAGGGWGDLNPRKAGTRTQVPFLGSTCEIKINQSQVWWPVLLIPGSRNRRRADRCLGLTAFSEKAEGGNCWPRACSWLHKSVDKRGHLLKGPVKTHTVLSSVTFSQTPPQPRPEKTSTVLASRIRLSPATETFAWPSQLSLSETDVPGPAKRPAAPWTSLALNKYLSS